MAKAEIHSEPVKNRLVSVGLVVKTRIFGVSHGTTHYAVKRHEYSLMPELKTGELESIKDILKGMMEKAEQVPDDAEKPRSVGDVLKAPIDYEELLSEKNFLAELDVEALAKSFHWDDPQGRVNYADHHLFGRVRTGKDTYKMVAYQVLGRLESIDTNTAQFKLGNPLTMIRIATALKNNEKLPLIPKKIVWKD